MTMVVPDGLIGSVLGVHIIGAHATDMIHEAAVAMRHGGLRQRPDRGRPCAAGISNFALEQFGEVVYVDYPKTGASIAQGASLGVIESSKIVPDLSAPITETVVEINTGGTKAIEDVNADPKGNGWNLRIRITRGDELAPLLTSAQYLSHVGAH